MKEKVASQIPNEITEYNKMRPKGSGDMGRTQNLRVNPITLICDLESR